MESPRLTSVILTLSCCSFLYEISCPEILKWGVGFDKVFILREFPFLLFLCSILAFWDFFGFLLILGCWILISLSFVWNPVLKWGLTSQFWEFTEDWLPVRGPPSPDNSILATVYLYSAGIGKSRALLVLHVLHILALSAFHWICIGSLGFSCFGIHQLATYCFL